jgi:hypothetical protein
LVARASGTRIAQLISVPNFSEREEHADPDKGVVWTGAGLCYAAGVKAPPVQGSTIINAIEYD